MEMAIKALEEALRELQEAERRTKAKKTLEHLRRAIMLVNEAHHALTT